MNVGVARVDITPPVGTRLSGFAGRDWRSEGVRDPLNATALWLQESERAALLLSIDTIGLTLRDNARLRMQVSNALGIVSGSVLVACSHTHAGAATMDIRATGNKEHAWTRELLQRCVEAATMARRNAAQVRRVETGSAACPAAINRRDPAGPNEDAVRTLVFHTDRPVATVVHTAMHPVSLGNQDRRISADWVGDARRIVESAAEMPMVFLQGCCGDINPRVRDVQAIGSEVGAAAIGAIESACETDACLRVGSALGAIPFRALPPDAALDARESDAVAILNSDNVSLAAHQLANADRAWVRRCRALRQRGLDGPKDIRFRCTALGIGDVDWVGWPGEVFHAIGQQLTAQFPSAWPVGFGAGNIGYLYPDSALPEGGYEVDLAFRLYGERQADAGTGDALLTAARRALETGKKNR